MPKIHIFYIARFSHCPYPGLILVFVDVK